MWKSPDQAYDSKNGMRGTQASSGYNNELIIHN